VLMVFYCVRTAGFCSGDCNDDEDTSMHWCACSSGPLKFENALSVDRRGDLVARLDRVRAISHEFGYGVGDDMGSFFRSTRGVEGDHP